MSRWVATRIECGCDCCSYLEIDSWELREDVPAEYWSDPNIEMDFEEDDE